MTRKECLTDRTCKLIEQGKIIVLKRADNVYLSQHTCIQAGLDRAQWTYWPSCAMEIFGLDLAFALASLYGCKVYSRKVRTTPYDNHP